MEKFTLEQVLEWDRVRQSQGMSNVAVVESFLRDKGLLAENKPLLTQTVNGEFPSNARLVQLMVQYQAALDKRRDKLVDAVAYLKHVGMDAMAILIEEEINAGIREGLWSAPEGWEAP